MNASPESLVKAAEEAYNSLDLERILALFAPDVVFYRNGKLVAKGIDAVRHWHEKFVASVKDYRLHKTLRAASGDTITLEFVETWTNVNDGQSMESFGGEFWTMEGDRLADWHLYWRGYPRTEGV